MDLHWLVTWAGTVIEVIGVGVMVVAAVVLPVHALTRLRSAGPGEAYALLRRQLGRAILLGLELLVAADIIRTVTAHVNLTQVGALAGIVLIRTFLSFALEVELEGRVPWRRAES